VSVTIASLAGIDRADTGVVSGLMNTTRQIGGAIGLAAISTIAATSTARYLHAHALGVASPPALDHGYQTALYVLTGLLLAAALLAAALVRAAVPHLAEAPIEKPADQFVLERGAGRHQPAEQWISPLPITAKTPRRLS
jgi:hypothetical protein